MRKYRYYALLAAAMLCVSAFGLMAGPQDQDATVRAIKVKELNLRKSRLQQQIRVEDQKRNRVMNGVSAQTQERLNDRQDSLCLELRSQLVAVELELKELVPDGAASAIATQLEAMGSAQAE